MNPDYSIIIPHKDTPSLLERCIDSIPIRSDTEIIIIDDNSNLSQREFDTFPGRKRKDVKVIFCKTNLGAGIARNKGIELAEGKWLIFADSDDFFTENYNLALDKYKDYQSDVVLFDINVVMSDDPTVKSSRSAYYREAIHKQYLTEKEILIRCGTPWAKLIKREMLIRHNIRFDNRKCAEDQIFIAKVVCVAEDIIVDKDFVLYCLTYRDNSLSTEISIESLNVRVRAVNDQYKYISRYGLSGILPVYYYLIEENWGVKFGFLTEIRTIASLTFSGALFHKCNDCPLGRKGMLLKIYRMLKLSLKRTFATYLIS